MKGVKSVFSFTKSVFSKSSSTHPKTRDFSAKSQSENQQPPPPQDDFYDDLVSPFLYPSNLRPGGNALSKKSEEEDDDCSEKSQDDDIDTEKDGENYTYVPGRYQRTGPFRGSPIHLPGYPSLGYVSSGATVGEGNGPYRDHDQGHSSNEGVCTGCAGCSVCGAGCNGCHRNCPGCGRSGGN